MIKPILKTCEIEWFERPTIQHRNRSRDKICVRYMGAGYNMKHPWHLMTYDGSEVRISWNPIETLLDEVEESKENGHEWWVRDPICIRLRYRVLTKPVVYIGQKDT